MNRFPKNTNVWVVGKSGVQGNVYWHDSAENWVIETAETYFIYFPDIITHWQSLSKPPEETNV